MAAVQSQLPSFGWHITKLAAVAFRLRGQSKKQNGNFVMWTAAAAFALMRLPPQLNGSGVKAAWLSLAKSNVVRRRLTPKDHDHRFMHVIYTCYHALTCVRRTMVYSLSCALFVMNKCTHRCVSSDKIMRRPLNLKNIY